MDRQSDSYLSPKTLYRWGHGGIKSKSCLLQLNTCTSIWFCHQLVFTIKHHFIKCIKYYRMYFRQPFFVYTKKLTVIKQNIITVHVYSDRKNKTLNKKIITSCVNQPSLKEAWGTKQTSQDVGILIILLTYLVYTEQWKVTSFDFCNILRWMRLWWNVIKFIISWSDMV